ncbi:Sec23-binding domain of Sec16-domain-containing protein [Mrakia frigida]|uniref:Sec23-binding domain of Sec16-domain-containing protein n=1 Tax=Mrakia frigida TaxID=29902 RepID=UPI003FCC1BA5
MRLLAVMVGNEGRLMGSAKVEDEVRAVLLPHLRALSGPSAPPLLTPGLPVPLAMTSPSSNHNSIYSTSPPVQLGSGLASQRNSLEFNPSSHAVPSSSTSANRPANLDHLQGLLFRGEKKQAVQFATDEKMWSHALIISSCIDKQTWGEVVKAFARSELPCSEEGGPKGRDALRLTYEMFGGAGTATLTRALPTVGSAQPPSSLISVDAPPTTSSNSLETLSNWREIVAMLVSNRSLGDTEALNDLGDSLVSQGWTAAGHCCYILSAPTPPLDGLGSPVPPRVHLYGSSFSGNGSFDIDGVLVTEIIEYALSLIPVLKGQEVYSGIVYLQSYKLLHAFQLAEVGDNATAQR